MTGGQERILATEPGPLRLVILAEDRVTALASIEVRGGLLDVTGPQDRWTEAARQFIAVMRREWQAEMT
jgi:hypothetical protein